MPETREMDKTHQSDFRAGIKCISIIVVAFTMLYWNQPVWTRHVVTRSAFKYSKKKGFVVNAIGRNVNIHGGWCTIGEPCDGHVSWLLQNAGSATWPPNDITIQAEGGKPIPVNPDAEVKAGGETEVGVRLSIRELTSERVKFQVNSSTGEKLTLLRTDSLQASHLRSQMLLTRVARQYPHLYEGANTNMCDGMRLFERVSATGMTTILLVGTCISICFAFSWRNAVVLFAICVLLVAGSEPVFASGVFVFATIFSSVVFFYCLTRWRYTDDPASLMFAKSWIPRGGFLCKVVVVPFLAFHALQQIVENMEVVLSCDVLPTNGPGLIATFGEKERQSEFITCCVQVAFVPAYLQIALRLLSAEDHSSMEAIGFSWDALRVDFQRWINTRMNTIRFSRDTLREGFQRWIQPLWYISWMSLIVMLPSYPEEHEQDHVIVESNALRLSVRILGLLERYLSFLPFDVAWVHFLARIIVVVMLWIAGGVFTRLPNMSNPLFVLHWIAFFFWWSGWTMPVLLGFLYYAMVDDLTDKLTEIEDLLKNFKTKACMQKLVAANESLRGLAIKRAEQLEWVWLLVSINVVFVFGMDVALLYDILQKGQASVRGDTILTLTMNLIRIGIWSIRVLMVVSLWYATCSKGMEFAIRSQKLSGRAMSQRMKLKAADGGADEETERPVLTATACDNTAPASYRDAETMQDYMSKRGPKMPHFKEMGGIILDASFMKICGQFLILDMLVKLSITSGEFLPLWRNILGMK